MSLPLIGAGPSCAGGGGGPSYEDFTGYTEVDPDTDVTVAENTLTVDTMDRTGDTYVYADKGAGAIDQFEHRFEFVISAVDDNGIMIPWAVSNVVEDAAYWQTNDSQALECRPQKSGGTFRVGLHCAEDVVGYYDYTEAVSVGATYYCTVDRNSDTTARLRIYDDAARTSLVDTLQVTIPSGRTWRYLFALVNYTPGTYGGDAASGTVANLEIVA